MQIKGGDLDTRRRCSIDKRRISGYKEGLYMKEGDLDTRKNLNTKGRSVLKEDTRWRSRHKEEICMKRGGFDEKRRSGYKE